MKNQRNRIQQILIKIKKAIIDKTQTKSSKLLRYSINPSSHFLSRNQNTLVKSSQVNHKQLKRYYRLTDAYRLRQTEIVAKVGEKKKG